MPWNRQSSVGRIRTARGFAGLTCATHATHVEHMPKMIQVRNVPEPLHRTLRVRAAQAGMSLSDYLLAELRRLAERPTLAELRQRIAARERVRPGEAAAAAIRAEREAREAQFGKAAAARHGKRSAPRRRQSA